MQASSDSRPPTEGPRDAQPTMSRPLVASNPPPLASALDQNGEPAFSHADLVTGKPLLLLFCPPGVGESSTPLLAAFRDRGEEFAALEANLHAVSRLPIELNR